MTGPTVRRTMTLAAALAAALSGCGAAPEPAPTAQLTSQAPAADPSDTRPSPAVAPTVTRSWGDPSPGASLSVTDLRIAAHDGFDRVVYEFDGAGTPGWSVRYVEQAVQDGSGKVVDVPGLSTLEVSLTGTGYPFDTGVDEYSGPDPLAGAGAITEATIATVFEGITQSFIGLSTTPRPVTVSLLADPVRVVVDVAR